MFETHLTVVGTLITNVNRRRLADDSSVVNFRVACTERRFDRATESWGDGDSLYVSVTCWRQLAENVHRTLTIGDPIIVRGRLRTRNYEDKDGRRQSVIELEGLAVGPDLTRSAARVTRLRRDGTPVLAIAAGTNGEPAGTAGEKGIEREADRDVVITSDDPWQLDRNEARSEPASHHEQVAERDLAEAAVGA